MAGHRTHSKRKHRKTRMLWWMLAAGAGGGIIALACILARPAPLRAPGPPTATSTASGQLVPYTGRIYHIFFHSLVIHPQLAFVPGRQGRLFEDYMITRDEFEKILPELYAKDFVLIDIHSIYSVAPDGKVSKKTLYLPRGKKPLIISVDDLNYYSFMSGHGFAQRLVLDDHGNVATEVQAPNGTVSVTRDGDVVPILDDFVAAHPDFSVGGAKGTIALTGFEGILGYRTEAASSTDPAERARETAAAEKVVQRLRATGWNFASHSYSHAHSFQTGTIPLAELEADTQRWLSEVEPLVGPTDIFIGPSGQVFAPDDPRRRSLIAAGFKMFCGVGADDYLRYFDDSVAMDRTDIDGYRLTHTPQLLAPYGTGVRAL